MAELKDNRIGQGGVFVQRGTDELRSQSIRLIIADDMVPIREYLRMILSREPDMKVIDAVGTGSKAVDRSLIVRPDVLLLDLEMETPRAGIEAIHTLAAPGSRIRCVVLTHYRDEDMLFAAFEAGAADYILKDSPTAEIVEAVRMAAHDQRPIRPLVARMIRDELRDLRSELDVSVVTLQIIFNLSSKDLGILRLLANGKDENEIGRLQWVEASIIRNHVRNLLKKFNEPSIADLINRFSRLGILGIFTHEKDIGRKTCSKTRI